MPRPTSKTELQAAIARERGALDTYLETVTAEQMGEPGIVGEWSPKDVLAHLVAWEQMCLGWYRAGLRGELPALPAPGFKWNQTPALNQQIYEQYRDLPLTEILILYADSFTEITDLIEELPNDLLFTPGQYSWTGKNTMGTYFVSATSSHYLWARKEISKGFRAKAKVS